MIEQLQKKDNSLKIYFKNKKGLVIPYDGQPYTKQSPMMKNGVLVGLVRE